MIGTQINLIAKLFGIEIKRIRVIPDETGEWEVEKIIAKLLKTITGSSNFIIDVGASNGIQASNTYNLFKNGHPGVAIEPDPTKFASLALAFQNFPVNLFRGYATPENIISILKSCKTPEHPLFMSFDIDSYDYFVLHAILESYRPSVICVEINEKIPPPINFKVLYRPDLKYIGDHFYGMSISAVGEICKQFNYDIITLNYNNTFIVPHEENMISVALTPEEAYRMGYLNKPDRTIKFACNSNMEALLSMGPNEGIKFINKFFLEYRGKYSLTCNEEQ